MIIQHHMSFFGYTLMIHNHNPMRIFVLLCEFLKNITPSQRQLWPGLFQKFAIVSTGAVTLKYARESLMHGFPLIVGMPCWPLHCEIWSIQGRRKEIRARGADRSKSATTTLGQQIYPRNGGHPRHFLGNIMGYASHSHINDCLFL